MLVRGLKATIIKLKNHISSAIQNMLSKRKVLISIVFVLISALALFFYFTGNSESKYLQLAKEAIARRDFNQANEYIDKHLQSHPDDKASLFLAGQASRRGGDLNKAFLHLRKCELQGGLDDSLNLEYRLLRLQQGEIDEIPKLMAEYQERLQSPQTLLVLEAVVLGTLKTMAPPPGLNVNLRDEAIPFLVLARKAVDLWLLMDTSQVDYTIGLFWRGRIRALLGDRSNGIPDFQQAISLDPNQDEARLHLALMISQAKPAEAAWHFAFLLNRNPSDQHIQYALAHIYRAIGRLDEAESLLSEILNANPNDVLVLLERGLLAMDRSQRSEAEQYLVRAFELSPNNPEVNLAFSQYMQLCGNTEKVKEYYARFEYLEAEKKRNQLQEEHRAKDKSQR
jgi:tetratricopeptide (TPR) repeat protein